MSDTRSNAGKPARQSGRFRREVIGPPECPLMVRWTLVQSRLGKVMVHHFLPDATDNVPHDHPASFLTFVLRGSYEDRAVCFGCEGEGVRWPDDSPCGACEGRGYLAQRMRPGTIRFRRAEHAHVTVAGPRGCWTVIVMGRKRRPWGFWHFGGWWPWREHELRFGMAMRCPTDPEDPSERAA